jgi:flagellar hook-associated protein 2
MSTIDGLVSGLDTTSVISQLMDLERRPLTQMQTRQTKFDNIVKAWTDIASKVTALRTAASALDTAAEAALFKATSSDTSVLTATAGKGATTGPINLSVGSLAVSHQLMARFATGSAPVGAGTAVITAGLAGISATGVAPTEDLTAGAHTITVTKEGADTFASLDGGEKQLITGSGPVTLAPPVPALGSLDVTFDAIPAAGTAKISVVRTTATATVADLAGAISAAGGPATAQVLDLGAGADDGLPARFVVTAAQTGTAGALTMTLTGFTGLTGDDLEPLREPGDAVVHIGTLTAVRSSNTISDLIPGVTLNLVKASPPDTEVTVQVGPDADALAAKVKALVDALNGVRSTVGKYTSYDADKKTAGVLLGDSSARALTSSLSTTTGQLLPTGAVRTLSQLGVTLNRDGTYAFDDSKLRAALSADQAGTADSLAGLTKSIAGWAKDSDGLTGLASRAKDAATAQSRDIRQQMDRFQVILDKREARFRTQFAKLETTLGQLRDQSTWLAGQIASLSSG